MALLVWLSLCSLFAAAFSSEAYIKTNQWSDRSVIVQMFEWKWLDIADECERFLGPKKYGAVQTSPASENLVLLLGGNIRPWYERYQVMSYKLTTRSGDEAAFLNMTTRCNKVGVRVYVDVVFNHMTGDNGESIGTGGSTAATQNNSFPGVPYTDQHFHHPVCAMENLNNATEVRVCQLTGLKDLNQTIPYVRTKIIDYLNNLIDLGAAGIRVDAAKHMWPEDLNEIYKHLHNLNTNHGFRKNSRPYIYQEVSNGGVVTYNEYKDMGDITEFTAGSELSQVFFGEKPLKNLSSYGTTALDMMPSENAVVFVDNHDTQRSDGILTYKNGAIYQAALAFLLAHPYGQARITSSYYFTDFTQGPPADSNQNITPPVLDTILAALNFYARGSYQGAVGLSSDGPMAQQTVSRCLRHVTNALNRPSILRKYIKFPQNLAERNFIKRQFYENYGLPGIVGCVDCTHVALVRPNEYEERFFNRKHFHSLNVQVICDAECTILNADASYGGATHDSFIWSHHEIKTHLESLQQETVHLLGDSGYPLREFMMTPIDNAVEDSPEGRYNDLQKRARATIERTFGILKGRWRCLLAARELHYAPVTAGKIVIACCVLHNMCNRAGLEAPSLTEEDMQLERSRQGDYSNSISTHEALQQGQRARDALVQLLERNRTMGVGTAGRW